MLFKAVLCVLLVYSYLSKLESSSLTQVKSYHAILSRLEAHMRRYEEHRIATDNNETYYQPFVTLTYAQTIDGSIGALSGNEQLILSCPESMLMTHELRSIHDAILVGVQTVHSDNPSLTVRLCSGKNPQPVILDSSLSINSSCRFVSFMQIR